MEWKEIPLKGDFPTPRAGHTATLVDNNQMIIFGGGVENGYSNEIFFLNLETMVWTAPKIEGTGPCPRAGHTAITILNKTAVLVFGGGFGEKVFGDLHMFDIEMCKWTRPSDAGYLPHARAGHSCVSVSNIAYFFGGADGDSHVFNDVHSLDTAFLVLKNLGQENGDELKFIKSVELSPMKNFRFFKEKCQDDLEQLEKKLDQMIFEQKNFHECNTFILRELSKRLEDNNSERFESLNAIQQELKRHREELFTQKEDREPPESCLQDEPSFSHSAAKTAQKQPQTDAAGAVPKPIEASEPDKGLTERKSGMVKNVCTLFESIAIDNFNSIARKMKVRGSKKKRG